MLAPGLATMLVVITTDAVLDAAQADAHLRAATTVSFDRLDSDGCMSTNDQVSLLVSGASGVTPSAEDFQAGLTAVCADLARKLQGDAEGASHDITIEVVHAASESDAVEVGRSRRPQQPLQGGDLRQRRELGPRARGDRHDRCRVRPVRRRRVDERRARLHGGRPRPSARRRRPRRRAPPISSSTSRSATRPPRSSPTTSPTTTSTRTAPTLHDRDPSRPIRTRPASRRRLSSSPSRGCGASATRSSSSSTAATRWSARSCRMPSPPTSSTSATSGSSPSSCTAAARRSRRCSTGSASRASSRAATASRAPRRSRSCGWC